MQKSEEKNKKLPGIFTRIISFIPVFNWIALIVLGKKCVHKISLICGILYGITTFVVSDIAAYVWIIVIIQYEVVRRKMKKKFAVENGVIDIVTQRNEIFIKPEIIMEKKNIQQVEETSKTISDNEKNFQVTFSDIVLGGEEEEKQIVPQKFVESENNGQSVFIPNINISLESGTSERIYLDEEDGFEINTSFYGYSSKTNFIKDMKKFLDKTGEKVPFVPFMTYWPSYDSMNQQQRAWYFYWRTEVRNGNYLDTDLSYIFIYVYELLSGYGWKNAQEGYDKLMTIWMQYRERYPRLDNYLVDWTFDFTQLHNLEYIEPKFNDMKFSYQQTIKDILIDKHSEDKPLKLSFVLIDSLCDYSLTGSKFYKEGHQLLIQEAIPRVIALVDVSQKLQEKGAIEKSGVSAKVDYLFVSGAGSDAWKFGKIGGKIAKALELQEKGIKIQIIAEEDMQSLLG